MNYTKNINYYSEEKNQLLWGEFNTHKDTNKQQIFVFNFDEKEGKNPYITRNKKDMEKFLSNLYTANLKEGIN